MHSCLRRLRCKNFNFSFSSRKNNYCQKQSDNFWFIGDDRLAKIVAKCPLRIEWFLNAQLLLFSFIICQVFKLMWKWKTIKIDCLICIRFSQQNKEQLAEGKGKNVFYFWKLRIAVGIVVDAGHYCCIGLHYYWHWLTYLWWWRVVSCP